VASAVAAQPASGASTPIERVRWALAMDKRLSIAVHFTSTGPV
jgi:hypothetical protein